jgi:predicted GIY-YIG superfamily endonuclease
MQGFIYLLHLSRPLGRPRSAAKRAEYGLPPRVGPYTPHAQHYLGFTPELAARLNAHRTGKTRAAKFIQAACAQGISFTLARVWRGTPQDEKRLKRYKNSPQLCPFCQDTPLNVAWLEEQPLT